MVPRIRVAVVAALLLAACNDVLITTNPGSIPEERLSDPALEGFIVNGVIGEFQYAYGSYANWSAALSDEAIGDHANAGLREFSHHDFGDLNGTNEGVYSNIQRARQAADDAVDRIRIMQGANAGTSLNLARALIYGGYGYVLLAEGVCDAPVNLSAALTANEIFVRGIARFDEGIAVATAAAAAATTTTNTAAAMDLLRLAQVGAARASLKRGDLAKARAYAAVVPDGYERWAYYSANSVRENNPVQVPTRTSQPFLGIHPVFQGLSDVRIPQPTAVRQSLNGNPILPPLKPSMYSGWSATGPAQPVEVATHIRFASGLEARYIGVEADGADAAMLTFVNARRTVGGKPPVSLSGPALLSEFRRQRAIDFYLTGQRLGDLRRYAAAGTDLFPTGRFPVGSENYGPRQCVIVPLSEKTGNPNYHSP